MKGHSNGAMLKKLDIYMKHETCSIANLFHGAVDDKIWLNIVRFILNLIRSADIMNIFKYFIE